MLLTAAIPPSSDQGKAEDAGLKPAATTYVVLYNDGIKEDAVKKQAVILAVAVAVAIASAALMVHGSRAGRVEAAAPDSPDLLPVLTRPWLPDRAASSRSLRTSR